MTTTATRIDTDLTATLHAVTAARGRFVHKVATRQVEGKLDGAVRDLAVAIKRAVVAGATVGEVLDVLAATPETAAPAAAPWEPFLDLTPEAFVQRHVSLLLELPWAAMSAWVGDEAAAPPEADRLMTVKGLDFIERELKGAGVPRSEWSMRRLVEALGAKPRGLRRAGEA